MARILVIEDEADTQRVLEYNLLQAGYEVTLAARGDEGLASARQRRPDLVLLDLMLPGLSGVDVCRALKQDPSTRRAPIVIVTARGHEIERVVGFELGADDYVVKPFSVRELLLRIRAILRRPGRPEPAPGALVRFGALTIDRAGHRVLYGAEEVGLSVLEFKLLTTLWDRRGRVQSRAALLDHVWGTDARISLRTVDAHVKRLREKLGPGRRYVETIRGVGYRFIESEEATLEPIEDGSMLPSPGPVPVHKPAAPEREERG